MDERDRRVDGLPVVRRMLVAMPMAMPPELLTSAAELRRRMAASFGKPSKPGATDGLFVDVRQHLERDAAEPALGVAHRGW
ncbi:MAG: hypothetical protein U0271_10365 [Polyangiaceae bacterium]